MDRIAEFVNLRSPEQKLRLVCQCVKRCYERGETVVVHVAYPADAERLDAMLWTFEDGTFIPHARLAEAQQPVIEPVVICCGEEPVSGADAFVEAGGGEPSRRFEGFSHAFDFAETYDAQLRELSRRRYKACQDAGYRMRFIE